MTTTMLFFDDESLTCRDNVQRKLGRARRLEPSVYHDPRGNCTWGYPAVFRDPTTGEWLLLYGVNFNPQWDAGGGSVALATSRDGLQWQPAGVGPVCPATGGLFASAFEANPAVPGLERFNLLYHAHPGGQLWTSSDGQQWRLVEGAAWQEPNPDPPTFVHWNPRRQRYVLSTRPDYCDRRIALFETTDFRSYTPLELALHTDSLDRSLTQIYGMPIFFYDGWFIGLPWMFDISATETGSLPHKYRGGKQTAQVAYSLNGWHWQRSLREPLFPNGEPGEPDGGCLQPSSMIRLGDGTLRFYASTSRHEHSHCPPDDGYIVSYELRRDGFVYLESDGGTGIVGTRPLFWLGGEVELNIQAPAGWVRVQVTDPRGQPLPGYTFSDSEVLHADRPAWTPTWKDGKTLAALADKMIRIEIQLENARLYALRGDYVECRLSDLIRLEKSGIRPTREPRK
ncbi:MAG: hypothetical protein PCFJNLEI_02172 [Verrucomicrobiae bacterium]|nr:hypothetical protein [Verrucomicrobiae bacterium]